MRGVVLFLAVIATTTIIGATPANAAGCALEQQVIGGCPNVNGGIQGDRAVLDGNVTGGGSPGTPGVGGPGAGAPGAGASGSASGTGSSTLPPMPCREVFAGLCYGEGQGKPVEPAPRTPTVTLSDIAVFRPQAAVQYMQPGGWMVVGLHTNFVAVIDRHVVPGTLLGAPADVRFTPVGYRWRYGDGSAARLSTTGASWQTLGVREFDATPTSHVYRASGTYVIELDVEYAAEYRFAGGAWRSLTGVIVLAANDLIATAGDAVTVLVDRDCGQAPAGPGC